MAPNINSQPPTQQPPQVTKFRSNLRFTFQGDVTTPYNMLRRTKSSSLLPIVRLTNYFYPENTEVKELELTNGMEVYPSTAKRVGSGGSTPDCEQIYRAMRLESFERIEDERIRKKYACQGI